MILKSFKFSSGEWALEGVDLKKTNLIVGKNSSGKSMLLRSMERFMAIISQKRSIFPISELDSEIILEDAEDVIAYGLSFSKGKVLRETLTLNGKTIISRDAYHSSINGDLVSPPADMLLLHVRRDVRRNPEIEKIIKWAEDSIIKSFISRDSSIEMESHEKVSKFSSDMKSHLVSMLRQVGFPISKIDTLDNHFNNGTLKSKNPEEELEKLPYLVVWEDNVGVLLANSLSSGMYRTIMLLILIEQLISLKHPALLAIDDLGEGLDYTRATKVGRLLFEECRKHNIQLIATSNEEFMMNIVDISQWNILMRKGKIVKSISSTICPNEFQEFKYSGLSNYDFFTSDFLNRLSGKLFDYKE